MVVLRRWGQHRPWLTTSKPREQLGILLFLLLERRASHDHCECNGCQKADILVRLHVLPPLKKRITCKQNDYVD